MYTPQTPDELFSAMVLRKVVTIKGYTGLVNAIEMEDGSGKSFNVRMCITPGNYHTVYTNFKKG